MSFDLCVLYTDKVISAKEAGSIYQQLCDGEIDAVLPSEKIEDFLKQLTSIYPQIHEYGDEDIDNCPWSASFDVYEGAICMCIAWSRADEIARMVKKLAA